MADITFFLNKQANSTEIEKAQNALKPKTKNTFFSELWWLLKELVFFVFPRKKLVFSSKARFFPYEKVGFKGSGFPKPNVFLGKNVFFSILFLPKTNFFLGKTWFLEFVSSKN